MYISQIIRVDMPNYDEVLKDSIVLIDFWAEWCEPCKVQDPILEEIAKELEGELVIGKVNVDDNKYLTQKNAIGSIPSMILFKNGLEIERWTGLHSKDVIVSAIKNVIN